MILLKKIIRKILFITQNSDSYNGTNYSSIVRGLKFSYIRQFESKSSTNDYSVSIIAEEGEINLITISRHWTDELEIIFSHTLKNNEYLKQEVLNLISNIHSNLILKIERERDESAKSLRFSLNKINGED